MANKFLDENGLLYFWQKITAKFATKEEIANAGAGDMLKSVYDTNNNGKVDNADNSDKLGGQSPSYYAPASSVPTQLSQLTEDATHRVVTDTEKSTWNSKANGTHKHEQGDINGLETALANMTAIAQGKCASYVFETVSELDTWLGNATNKAKLEVGDVFLIKAVDVPDYWWDGSAKQVLETTKVDLTTITNAEIDTIVAS